MGCWEHLAFRDGAFDGAVCGFALRDSLDLESAVQQVSRVVRKGGRFAFCDLGKPDSSAKGVAVAVYLRVAPNLIGLASAGRAGLRYGSIFDTYMLTLKNSQLAALLGRFFSSVSIHEEQLGGSIVTKCVR